MRRKLAACTAVLVAAASVGMCCRPVPVYADAGNFAGYMDYVATVSVPAATAALGSTAVYAVDFAALALASYAFSTLDYDNNVYPEIAGQGACIYGTYRYKGLEYPGIMFTYSNMSTGNRVVMPLFSSPHLIVNAGMTSANPTTILWSNGGVPNNSSVVMQTYRLATSVDFFTDFIGGGSTTNFTTNGQLVSLRYATSVPDWGATLPIASAYTQTLYDNVKAPLMSGLRSYDFQRDFDPANIQGEWNDYMLPYLQQYPELDPYLPEPFEPDTPYEPIYPTDFVTGMPKNWTVENPPLPTSPQMNIDIPDASLPDLSGVTQYTEGVGFWWSLTGWVMDAFGIREIVLLLIGIGVFAYVLYRLGAG